MRGNNICFYAELPKIIPNYQTRKFTLRNLATGSMKEKFCMFLCSDIEKRKEFSFIEEVNSLLYFEF